MADAQLDNIVGAIEADLETMFACFESLDNCSHEMRDIIKDFVKPSVKVEEIDLESNKLKYDETKGTLLVSQTTCYGT